MISTRAHGVIDYGVASLFGSLAVSRRLSKPVRVIFGAAGAYHTAYSLLTDYEAGVQPLIGMPQHLALDAGGAAGLIASAVLLRKQPIGSRLLLLSAALAEFAVIAASDTSRYRSPQASPFHDAAPTDRPKPIAEDVFVVDSVMQRPFLSLPVRMTILRLKDGNLLLHSPTRLTPSLREGVEQLGRIRYLVAPNSVHWMFLPDWQRAFPDAETWAAPGLRRRQQVRRSGIRLDHDLNEFPPVDWDGVQLVVVPGGMGFREVALFHVPSRTMLLTDLILDLPSKQVSPVLQPVARMLGIIESEGAPPIYLRWIIRLQRKEAARAAKRLLAMKPERVVFAHGSWFRRDGSAALRHALRWLLQ